MKHFYKQLNGKWTIAQFNSNKNLERIYLIGAWHIYCSLSATPLLAQPK